MPVSEFSIKTPTIKQVMLYTYTNSRINNRFDFSKRDILPSKIKVIDKLVYKPSKQTTGTTPDQRLDIISYSAPQYRPYTKGVKKGSRQMKHKHQYDVVISLQKDSNGQYSYQGSRMKWRVGSYRKWEEDVPQSKVKTVYNTTRDKLKKKYKDNYSAYLIEIKNIRIRGKYLDKGDYNSQVNGLNGDCYWRDQYWQKMYDCLYGPLWYKEPHTHEKKIRYPFCDKHLIAVIMFLIKKNIIKR